MKQKNPNDRTSVGPWSTKRAGPLGVFNIRSDEIPSKLKGPFGDIEM